MNENRIRRVNDYLADEYAHCLSREAELNADGRRDEAVFSRIRGNVFDIFRTVFSAAVSAAGDDCESIPGLFSDRLESIPKSWQASLEKAEAHADIEKAHIERVKLDAAAELAAEIERIWRETP